ncbi:MAG: Transcriptional regulator, AraC family [uncultured Rubrobacteraceae bacterium]|uniref:Transcriptional regulator, AraC family n=1 Tax=uncultured Rubrobacteraceae bacterium TaxID=349277 RepID=A0A6J4THL2_9ACTN|nr:MAG: Transcriptional regulator, AraC family [uncultured Rubrobacteraceae bacterium]
MSGTEELTLPDLRRAAPGAEPPRKIGAGRISRAVEEVSVPGLPEHLVMVNVGRPYRLEERLDGRVYRTFGVRGDVALIPAGTPTEFRSLSPERQTVESLAISLDPVFVRRVAEADLNADGVELIGTLGGRDPEIERIGAALLPEIGDNDPFGALYVDSLANLLAVHLLRHHSSLGRRRARETGPRGGLPATALRSVTDYVEENLAGGLTLEEISAVAHMSPFHFSRLFKASTGLSPHRYVVGRRVERARELLAKTALPLHEVARLAGFTDQSHLAKHFRRHLGVTPSRFRTISA